MVKYTNGMWMLREGVKIEWMQNAEKVVEKADEVKIVLTKHLRHRGDTLNSPTITTYITSPLEGIIGVKHVHWAGKLNRGPHFELNSSTPKVDIRKEVHQATVEDELVNVTSTLDYTSGGLKLSTNTRLNELGFTFLDSNGTKLTGHSFRSIGYVRDNTRGEPFQVGMFRRAHGSMLCALDLAVGEKVYGLGERFGPFVKNGQTVDIWNEDGGTCSELSYKNIPFYMTSRGYGVFINHPSKVSLEVQSERTTRVNISVEDESIQYFVIYGPTPREIIRKYTALTGRPALPPAWTYDLWLTTSFTTNYSEQTVTHFLDGFRDRDIPLGTFHFDCFWMKGYQWCDFEFDENMFPDAKGYIARLKERGLKICVWINPYIAQESALFEEGINNGYFIKRTEGSVWQWDMWQAGMAIVDFTNPHARTWYESHLHRLIDMGIDSFKTDFGERIPFQDVQYYDNSDSSKMHNYYTFMFNQCVHNVLQDRLGQTTGGCVFARSATVGGQQFPVHWGGDCESTFEAMAESLRGGLSLSLCGFGFWAHDIGGFEGTPDPAIYKRWCQFGLLSSHSRLHGSSSFRVPWLFGEDACTVLRDFSLLKLSLLPYLLQEGRYAHDTGLSIMRAMFVEFPEDRNTYTVDTQYMFGSNLLVAPVFSHNGDVEFYVPESPETGDAPWISWFNGKKYKPGKWYKEIHDFDTLPLLVRPGTVTLVNRKIKHTRIQDFYSDGGLELVICGPLPQELQLDLVNPARCDEVTGHLTVSHDKSQGICRISKHFSGDAQLSVRYLGGKLEQNADGDFDLRDLLLGQASDSITIELKSVVNINYRHGSSQTS